MQHQTQPGCDCYLLQTAPEALSGDLVTKQADIYCFGLLLLVRTIVIAGPEHASGSLSADAVPHLIPHGLQEMVSSEASQHGAPCSLP